MDSDDEYGAFSATLSTNLIPCDICGRKFNSDALIRHSPICAKGAAKKRKVFDMSKQRIEGTDIKAVPKTRGGIQKSIASPSSKGSNWRLQHKQFIQTIRAARGVQAALDSGKPLPPPPPPTINPDYVQCEYCDRRFNSTAAERHIPFCKEQQMRKGINKPKPKVQYKAPLPKARATSAANRAGRGFSPGSTAPSRPPAGRTGAPRPTTMTKVQTSNGNNRGYSDAYDAYESGSVSPGTGPSLRTGRNAETYSDARDLSAKAKVQALSKKFPSNDSIHKGSYSRDDYTDPRYTSYSSPSPEPSPSRGPARRPPSGSSKIHGTEPSYYCNNNDEHLSGTRNNRRSSSARFCHDCGTKYPVSNAKFCCECGIRRLTIS